MNNKLYRSFTAVISVGLIAMLSLPSFARAGSIVSWGNNVYGVVSNTPVGSGFAAIAAGDYHSLALRIDGSIASWGRDEFSYPLVRDTPTEDGFIAIAAGPNYSLALRANGTIVFWGYDSSGQVSNTPTESGFTAIDGGRMHSLALTADGSIVSWGSDYMGLVTNTPTESGFTAIATGDNHSLAMRADGTIVSWGEDESGVVSDTPTEGGFTAIATGARNSLALRADGSIVSWGWDVVGQVTFTPTENGFTAIAVEDSTCFALSDDGSIVSWGDNDPSTPTKSGFTAISAGYYRALALAPSLSVLEPNGNERLKGGRQYEIKWAGGFVSAEVLVEYSGNNGADWGTITTVQDANSYSWQVTVPASNDYLVRVTDTAFPTVTDTSDSTFLVYACAENLVGDFNLDCRVDLLDFAVIAQMFLTESYNVIYHFALNTTANWTTEGQWQFGIPTGNGGGSIGYPDPSSGYTGSYVYGVNLNGDYSIAVGGPYYLTAGPFDCNGFGDMRLRFARWLNTDNSSYVQSKVQASNDGAVWQTVWENTSEVTDSSWQVVEYDISATADSQSTVYIRWGYEVLDDRAYLCSGWNIDDIELLGRP